MDGRHFELGKSYRIPFVRSLGSVAAEPGGRWWPVLEPAHTDAELLPGVNLPHWHIDWRFVSESLFGRTVRWHARHGYVIAYGTVIFVVESPADFAGTNITMMREPVGRVAVMRRALPEFPHLPNTYKKIRGFHRPLDRCMRCPHRGIDLSNVAPDEHGVITCPGHGLKWIAATGEPLPPPS